MKASSFDAHILTQLCCSLFRPVFMENQLNRVWRRGVAGCCWGSHQSALSPKSMLWLHQFYLSLYEKMLTGWCYSTECRFNKSYHTQTLTLRSGIYPSQDDQRHPGPRSLEQKNERRYFKSSLNSEWRTFSICSSKEGRHK